MVGKQAFDTVAGTPHRLGVPEHGWAPVAGEIRTHTHTLTQQRDQQPHFLLVQGSLCCARVHCQCVVTVMTTVMRSSAAWLGLALAARCVFFSAEGSDSRREGGGGGLAVAAVESKPGSSESKPGRDMHD